MDSLAVRIENFEPRELCEINDWGPRSTGKDQSFNVQPNGDSAFWDSATGAPQGVTLGIGDLELHTEVTAELITTALRGEADSQILKNIGSYEIDILESSLGEKQKVGEFVVTKRVSKFRRVMQRVGRRLNSIFGSS